MVVAAELQELNGFVQSFQLMTFTNKVLQMSQSLMVLLKHVRAQQDMLSLRHLYPSIVTNSNLEELLLRMQVELPHHLELLVGLTRELCKYNMLGCYIVRG